VATLTHARAGAATGTNSTGKPTVLSGSLFLPRPDVVGSCPGSSVWPTDKAKLRIGLPGLRGYQEIPGVGHWPNREAPETFNAALLEFLSGL